MMESEAWDIFAKHHNNDVLHVLSLIIFLGYPRKLRHHMLYLAPEYPFKSALKQ